MKLTDEQIQAIIEDTAHKLELFISDPCDGDYSDLECYEDENGNCYDFGTHSFTYELEEICYDGLPGIDSDNADIFITAIVCADLSFHDDYDPGDYYTPPSGGIELDRVDAFISDIDIEINVINPMNNEYERMEVTSEVKDSILKTVNDKINSTDKRDVA